MNTLDSFIVAISSYFGGNPYLGIFLIILSTAVIPIAPPEEVLTLLAGACVGTTLVTPFKTALAVILGIAAVNSLQYGFGRLILKPCTQTVFGSRLISSSFLLKGERLMSDHGVKAIILSRFMFGTRTPVYIAAGFLRYSYPRFLAIDSVMVIGHAGVAMTIGYLGHAQIDMIIRFVSEYAVISTILAASIVAILILVRRSSRSKR